MKILPLRARARRLVVMTVVMAAMLPALSGISPAQSSNVVLADICSASRMQAKGGVDPKRESPKPPARSHGLHCPLCVPLAGSPPLPSGLAASLPVLPDHTSCAVAGAEPAQVPVAIVAAAQPRGPPARS